MNASDRRTRAWPSSSTRNRGSRPASNGCARSKREQKPWIVEIHARSTSRARSRRPRSRKRSRMRSFSSPAARSVYVITRTESTDRPRSATAFTYRSTSTVVLPVPAPAETKTIPDSSIAASWAGLTVGAGIYGRSIRHIVQRSHQRGQVWPRGSCRTSPTRIRSTAARARSCARSTVAQKPSSSR